MNEYILAQAEAHKQKVAQLRSLAPDYPEIYTQQKGATIWATTMVRFEYNGVAFRRHHAHSLIDTMPDTKKRLLDIIRSDAEQTQRLAAPTPFDEVIGVIEERRIIHQL